MGTMKVRLLVRISWGAARRRRRVLGCEQRPRFFAMRRDARGPIVLTYVRTYVYRTGLSREIESAIFAGAASAHTHTHTRTYVYTYTYTRVSLSGALTVALFRNDMHAAGRKIPADYAPSAARSSGPKGEEERGRERDNEEPEPELLPEREKR